MSEDKDLEQLLKLASNEVEIKEVQKSSKPKKLSPELRKLKDQSDFERFIFEMDLKPGKNNIHLSQIYNAYKNWSDDPMTFVIFNKYMGENFEKVKAFFNHHKFTSYSINMNNFRLQPKAIKLKEKRNAEKEKAENEKILREISSTESEDES